MKAIAPGGKRAARRRSAPAGRPNVRDAFLCETNVETGRSFVEQMWKHGSYFVSAKRSASRLEGADIGGGQEVTVRNRLIASIMLAGAGLAVGPAHANEPVKQLAGFFCQSPDDVKTIVRRIALSDNDGLADLLLSRMPDGINCAFALQQATFVKAALATVGDEDYMIIEFKDSSSGRKVYSWRRLDGAPA
jgi:hypothetical protein